MRFASFVINGDRGVLYAESSNRMGLLSASRPILLVDTSIPTTQLGELVKEALAGSRVIRGRVPDFVDRRHEVLRAAGLKSWSEWKWLPMCGIRDDDSGTLCFVPMHPDGKGHEGVRAESVIIPFASPTEAIGAALWKAVDKVRRTGGNNHP